MFDIGFWELLLIGLVALIVVGPERLPRLARTAGLWLGKGQALLSSVKADIDRELRAEELKRILEEQKKSAGLEEIIEQTSGVLGDTSRAVADAQTYDRDNKSTKDTPATATTTTSPGTAPTQPGSSDHGG